MNKNLIIKIAIAVGVLVVALFIYGLLAGDDSEPAPSVQREVFVGEGVANGEAQRLLRTLKNLENLELDTEIFDDPAFNALVDFGRPIQKRPVGRLNPFSAIDLTETPLDGSVGQTPPEVSDENGTTTDDVIIDDGAGDGSE